MEEGKLFQLVRQDYYIQPYEEQEQESLRSHMIQMPECINQCPGITIFGKTIKSIAVTTDVAVICNINADAVMAVYPFTPQTPIIKAITDVASVPVFAGVGGGLTRGVRTVNLANFAEQMGAYGVVVNSPIDDETITGLRSILEIPVIVTVVSKQTDVERRMIAGASMVNVAGGRDTPEIVSQIREDFPNIKIMATGGYSEKTIMDTIAAGADAITYTPQSSIALFSDTMDDYRHLDRVVNE